MSLVKAVPDGIKDKECERLALRECPPVPYMSEKDPVQETVSALKSDQSLKTAIGEDTELHIPIWHTGMREAFLMHVSTALNAIEKWCTFKADKEACKAYVEQRKAVKQAKAALVLQTAPMSKGEKTSKKSSKKASEKASPKAKEDATLANAPAPELHAEYQADYKNGKFAAETTKNKHEATATKMFQFYANLLSADAKYAWNKTVKEQTEMDPFKDLQGVSRKGPRGLLRESFDDCIMFYLLTVFPNNTAEQEKYYLSNVLKKPQRVGVRQFIQCIAQLNAYIVQLLCWYYSLSYNPGMTPVNVLFTEADLASHDLRMCPHQWQDQYNLQEKGMTPVDMHSLQASLEAIKLVCTLEKAHAQSGKKASQKSKTGTKRPSTGATKQVPKKVCFRKYCKLCKKYGGAHTTHATKDCCRYVKDGMVKADLCAAKKADKKPNPAKQSFAQLSKILDKLEKTLKKAPLKSKKCRRDDSDSNSE
jgi:hypothetical protein